MIDPLFTATLQDRNLPLVDGAAAILLELASSAPKLVTLPWIKRFWTAGCDLNISISTVKEWIFSIRNVLHLKDAGVAQLGQLFRDLQSETSNFRNDAAELFLGDLEHKLLLEHNQSPT